MKFNNQRIKLPSTISSVAVLSSGRDTHVWGGNSFWFVQALNKM